MLQDAVRLDGRSASAWLLLGLALGEAHRGAGDEALVRSAELAPSWAEPRYRRGELFASMGRFQDARTELEAALACDSGHAGARALLVTVYLRVGDPATAAEHARQLLARSPHDPAYQLLFARALVEQGRPGKALAFLAEPPAQVERDPERWPEWLLLRARALLSMYRWEEAERDLSSVTELQPGLAAGWVYRARLARGQRKARQALEYADEALAQEPDNVEALGLCGAALLDLGHRQPALRRRHRRRWTATRKTPSAWR